MTARSTAINPGEKYGMLTVQRFVSRKEALALGLCDGRWECLCDCGKIAYAPANHLVQAIRHSCGRKRRPESKPRQPSARKNADYTGMKFGILTAIERSHRDERQGWLWRFKCDCGEFCHIRIKDVRHGTTASCGCLKSLGGRGHGPTLAINRPWRKDEWKDDRWPMLVGDQCGPTVGAAS